MFSIDRILAEVAFRLFVWLVERVGSTKYVNDVVHSIHERCKRRGVEAGARSAVLALPHAIASRVAIGRDALYDAFGHIGDGLLDVGPVVLFVTLAQPILWLGVPAFNLFHILATGPARTPWTGSALVGLAVLLLLFWRWNFRWAFAAIAIATVGLFQPVTAAVSGLALAAIGSIIIVWGLSIAARSACIKVAQMDSVFVNLSVTCACVGIGLWKLFTTIAALPVDRSVGVYAVTIFLFAAPIVLGLALAILQARMDNLLPSVWRPKLTRDEWKMIRAGQREQDLARYQMPSRTFYCR